MSPFAFRVGVRSSVAATSLRRLVGVAQSHIEITRLRSRPEGRGGAFGYAPAAMRSVQSAYALRCAPMRLKLALMPGPLGPTVTWGSQASRLEVYEPRFFETSRVTRSPT